ncbi:MAG: ABC transporter permease subunit [Elusimicrobia bacterium]|nr:ABC transporter permease subunit [Elusimicrobiota bacterium]
MTRGATVLAAKEFREAASSRWLLSFLAAFCGLGALLAVLGSWTSPLGGAGFGRTSAALLNLVLLIVPLMGLVAGGLAFALERERRTLEFLLSLPLRPADVFWGKFAGAAAALFVALAGAFAVLGVFLALRGGLRDAGVYGAFFLVTLLLALTSLAVGMLAAARSRRVAGALGAALGAWLALVFGGDLGLLGSALAVRLPPAALLAAAWLNPLSLYRLLALEALACDLDVLGPAGLCARDALGAWLKPAAAAGLFAWLGGSLGAAWTLFRRDPLRRGA